MNFLRPHKSDFTNINIVQNPKPKAFSLLEVAVVLIIIGILVAATFSTLSLIKKSRILAAQTQTRSSPVSTINGLVIWLESSLEESFLSNEQNDGTELNIWKDIKNSSTSAINNGSSGTTKPTYSNTINSIPAVKFSGADTNYFEIDGTSLNNSDYTIIFLEKRQSAGVNYFLTDDGTSSVDNQKIQLGYSASETIIHSQGSGNNYNSSVGTYSSSEKPRIFTFIQSSSGGKKTYVNSFLAKESPDKSRLTGINKLHLGKNYNGEIGEFIIYDRALKAEERLSIEKYLAKKWMVKNVSDENCTDGSVTDSGCLSSSCIVSLNGSSATSLSSGSSAQFSCNQTGYVSGLTSATYSCVNGSISPSLSPSQCADDLGCASGYSKVSGSCSLQCTLSGEVGITDGTKVDSGSTSTSCKSGYIGSFEYTCDNGSYVVTNNSCAPNSISCTGGEAVDTTSYSGYTVHYFLAPGTSTLQCTGSSTSVEILVVGGGGGARSESGGGGAGGLVYKANHTINTGNYSVKVGNGGSGSTSGESSIFDTITAYGGGAGGGKSSAGIAGGSGGGGGRDGAGAGGASTKGIADGGEAFGNIGGAGSGSGSWRAAGGGGGAGSSGTVGSGGSQSLEISGNGGAGKNYGSIFGTTYGDNGWFAGGGGGSNNSGTSPNILTGGLGGQGGGGVGMAGSSRVGTNGAANTGGGAGGNSSNTTGGSGIVIVKYQGIGKGDRCAISVNGSSTSLVANGFNGSIACNQTGYTGSLSATCTDSVLSPSLATNSCAITNGCASGYNLFNNACEQQCSVSLYSDVLSVSAVNSGSSSQACKSSHSGTFTYSCSKGTLSSVVNGCTPKDKCSITGQTGIIEGFQVDSGTTSTACNHEDYSSSGELTYTCDNGSFTPISNNCALASASTLSCSGGTTSSFNGDKMHIFTSSSTLTCTGSGNAKVLVVGGGGGSGGNEYGGGGAGAVVYLANYNLTAGSHNATVGSGGNNANGGSSTFGTITVNGGGRGGAKSNSGILGGSGGGVGRDRNNAAVLGGNSNIGTTGGGVGYGNSGGTSSSLGSWQGAGGGGGAGSSGQNSSGGSQSLETGGNGGEGINLSSIFGTTYGSSGWFAAGGGGATFGNGSSVSSKGLGGQGGGGNGFINNVRSATSGAPNTGSGAGGGSSVIGGSGIIIIRYTEGI